MVISSGIQSFTDNQVQQAIKENIEQLEGNYTLLSVPGNNIIGAYFIFNDADQYQQKECLVEVFNEHQYIDCFNPQKPNVFVLPKEWVDLNELAPRSYIEVDIAVDKIISINSPDLSDLDASNFFIHIFGASIQSATKDEEWEDG